MRGLVAVATLLAASCGFATRSEEFACDGDGGCPDGRTCVSGWCVTEASLPDASQEPPIECEPDQPCVVVCDQPGSCAGGINCQGAESCDITCSGEDSCAGHIECEAGRCNVVCSGSGSCAGSIDCDDACACDVSCEGDGSCLSDVDCPFTGQCRDGDECTSTASETCDRC
jgi:hypothetical protein